MKHPKRIIRYGISSVGIALFVAALMLGCHSKGSPPASTDLPSDFWTQSLGATTSSYHFPAGTFKKWYTISLQVDGNKRFVVCDNPKSALDVETAIFFSPGQTFSTAKEMFVVVRCSDSKGKTALSTMVENPLKGMGGMGQMGGGGAASNSSPTIPAELIHITGNGTWTSGSISSPKAMLRDVKIIIEEQEPGAKGNVKVPPAANKLDNKLTGGKRR